MISMVHKKVKKHVSKHKRKYTRFILYFLILLIFGVIEDVTAVYLTSGEEIIEVIVVAIVLSFIFTLIGEVIETVWMYNKKKLRK